MYNTRLQYISAGRTAEEHYRNIKRALEIGIHWIQLRLKNTSSITIRDLAKQIIALKDRYDFTFIINDNPEIAYEVRADGVHLGLTDMPIIEARRLLGDHLIIGGTANTYTDVLQRIDENCDYIGLGPFRHTRTKSNLSPILGLQGYADILQKLQLPVIPPIYAIGGITDTDISNLLELGIHGVAMSKDVQDHFQDELYIHNLNALLYEH